MTKKKFSKLPLKFDLQFFAQDPPAGDPPPADPPGGNPPADPPAGDPPKTFTQEELDAIVKDRLARAKKKAEEEAERKRLEDEGKIKELYEKTKTDLENLQKQLHAKEVDDIKTKAILSAGYTVEQTEFVKGIVKGESEDEIKASLADIQKFVKPGTAAPGADPSPGNPPRNDPQPKSDEEFGRALFQRLRGKK